MFYKKYNSGWHKGKNIFLPSGKVLTVDNKESIDGWEWSETPPKEYLNWKSEQELNDGLGDDFFDSIL